MQQLTQNYFQLFGLPQTFALDSTRLAEKYRELQIEAHPDRFAGAGEEEKMRAVQFTSYINEAYATLKSPLKRAAYLLSLHDVDTERVSQEDLGPGLLLEQMEWREELANLPGDESALDRLVSMRAGAQARIEAREKAFANHLENGELEAAKRIFHELQFLYKLKSEIDQGEEERLGI